MKRMPALFLLLAFLWTFTSPALAQRGNPVRGTQGMVVSAHVEASRAGQQILAEGGNGVDAAVATGFALAVVYPVAGNVGGGGFMVIRFPDGTATTIDYREMAPAAATRDMYLDENGTFVPSRSQRGHLASGVPGAVAGMLDAHAAHGVLPLAQVMAPAIRLAEEGFPLTYEDAMSLNTFRTRFLEFPGTRHYFTKADGSLYEMGEVFTQRDLGQVLRRIAERGKAGFYEGETADLLVAEMERGGGIITHEDLRNYVAVERAPVIGQYRGHRILTMGPPSSGGIALLQLLQSVEPFPLAEMGWNSSATAHLYGEAMRRAYADRAEFLGDPDFVTVPQDGLLAPDYIRARMANFDPERASRSADISHGNPYPAEPMETTHYSIVDKDGMAVSVTTTINGGFGSFVVVEGAGFFMNNEMDDFAAAPGVPNMFGLVGNEANSIAPGKRMLSSMTPTIVEDPAGRLMLVIGAPGGSTIITTVFQVITNIVDFGMNVQEAVSAPRIHHQWLPDTLMPERFALSEDAMAALERRGWNVVRAGRRQWGQADGVMVRYDTAAESVDPSGLERLRQDISGRLLEGGADPRGQSTAVGY